MISAKIETDPIVGGILMSISILQRVFTSVNSYCFFTQDDKSVGLAIQTGPVCMDVLLECKWLVRIINAGTGNKDGRTTS